MGLQSSYLFFCGYVEQRFVHCLGSVYQETFSVTRPGRCTTFRRAAEEEKTKNDRKGDSKGESKRRVKEASQRGESKRRVKEASQRGESRRRVKEANQRGESKGEKWREGKRREKGKGRKGGRK
jgi:hypothetical protein